MKRTLLTLIAIGAAAGVLAQTSTSTADKSSPQTQKFLKEATRGNDLEVALAEVGARKAQNPELKSFSQQMQQDRMQLNQQLKPLAQQYGVALDQSLDSKDQKEVTKLENESSTKFDQELAKRFLREHQKDINAYERASKEALPADVKQFAQMTLPKLQQHFQHAQEVAKAVGVDEATISSFVNHVPEGVGGTGTAQEPEPATGAGAKTDKGAGAKQLEQGKPPGQP